MCGRYTLTAPADEIVETFDVGPLTFEYFARYNIGPGQHAPIVAQDRRGRRAGLLTWGLIPAWRDEPGGGLFNARAESVAEKPSFREAFRRRRCLVPADGFYEWSRDQATESDGKKQPFWIHPLEGGVIAFAGLWERWSRPGSEDRNTFTILTTDASEDIRPLHHRMPVVIGADDFDAWLDGDTSPASLERLLRPAPPATFASHPVSRRVNRVGEEGEDLVAPLGVEDVTEREG